MLKKLLPIIAITTLGISSAFATSTQSTYSFLEKQTPTELTKDVAGGNGMKIVLDSKLKISKSTTNEKLFQNQYLYTAIKSEDGKTLKITSVTYFTAPTE